MPQKKSGNEVAFTAVRLESTGEGWVDVLWEYMRRKDGHHLKLLVQG